ncbi:hypothetical protein GC174_17890 [bacterium]|nr:hypothetical protein [bacterium]
MSINLIWRLATGIILASDSLTTLRKGETVIARHTQKTFELCCQMPLGAVCSGSPIVGNLPVTQLLSQNYEQERDSLEGFAELIHEEVREAIKQRHKQIETQNFAIHLAGYCPIKQQFQHFVTATKQKELAPLKEMDEKLFVGGNLAGVEIGILKKAGLTPLTAANFELEEGVDKVRMAMKQIFDLGCLNKSAPAQILAIEKSRVTWVEGPLRGSIVDLV